MKCSHAGNLAVPIRSNCKRCLLLALKRAMSQSVLYSGPRGGSSAHVHVRVAAWLCVALSSWPLAVGAQASPREDDADLLGPAPEEPGESESDVTEEAVGVEQANEPVAAAPALPPIALVPPPSAPPSLFLFTLRGTIASTLFLQDVPFGGGNGGAALLGPLNTPIDGWFFGGDIRQTRLSFNLRGPEIFGAVPTAAIEFELAGGNQITTVPGANATVTVRDAMGNVVGTTTVPAFTSSAQGDESLLPRLRTAYVEMNWDAGQNLVRVGQYHNLLLAMVSASGAHPATLGYGAGQLGWRAPGVMYSHKFKLGEDANLDAAVQLNRNSWIDNAPICPATLTPPVTNCLPSGVSLGEASLLPQVEARLLFSGGKEESPFPHYAPTVWQFHIVGHWDQKDLSGVGNVAPPNLRDSMTTYAIEVGGKLKLGPVLIAANGWYGQNAGGVYGHMFQMQFPDKPDVTGFGAWGQAGFSLSRAFSLWAFAGIDRPNRAEAIAAGFARLQNIQLCGMLAYTEGPLVITLEWFNVATTSYIPGAAATATAPATVPQELTFRGNQPSVTLAYNF
jgi:hypothetical protein